MIQCYRTHQAFLFLKEELAVCQEAPFFHTDSFRETLPLPKAQNPSQVGTKNLKKCYQVCLETKSNLKQYLTQAVVNL